MHFDKNIFPIERWMAVSLYPNPNPPSIGLIFSQIRNRFFVTSPHHIWCPPHLQETLLCTFRWHWWSPSTSPTSSLSPSSLPPRHVTRDVYIMSSQQIHPFYHTNQAEVLNIDPSCLYTQHGMPQCKPHKYTVFIIYKNLIEWLYAHHVEIREISSDLIYPRLNKTPRRSASHINTTHCSFKNIWRAEIN